MSEARRHDYSVKRQELLFNIVVIKFFGMDVYEVEFAVVVCGSLKQRF